jgi:hypothetical protein
MRPDGEAVCSNRAGSPRPRSAERIGLARLTRAAEAGRDLCPLSRRLIARLLDGSIEAGEGLDLSLIAQLLGDASAGKRAEEAIFMQMFEQGFARRHRAALLELSSRIGLDDFTEDCAETRCGSLVIFEADNTAIVHEVPQMRKVFDAFAAMLFHRAGRASEAAA